MMCPGIKGQLFGVLYVRAMSVGELQGAKSWFGSVGLWTMISVIITAFEQPDSLLALLHCLKAQDVDEPFEILICDDGSSRWLEEPSRHSTLSGLDIRYIWQSKKGHRAARSKNNGLRCARGNLIVHLDADILVRPDFLRNHRQVRSTTHELVCNPRRWILGEEFRSISKSDGKTVKVASALKALAIENLSGMYCLLDRIGVDIERQSQSELSFSSSPWMACMGFSFSYDRPLSSCLFNEGFEGWGPEDREFALRLWSEHGYSVKYCDDIIVYHLEACSTGRTPFASIPNAAPHIIPFLKNMLYFRDLYPDVDLSHLMRSILAYKFSTERDCWEYCAVESQADLAMKPIETQLAAIRRWLKRSERFGR